MKTLRVFSIIALVGIIFIICVNTALIFIYKDSPLLRIGVDLGLLIPLWPVLKLMSVSQIEKEYGDSVEKKIAGIDRGVLTFMWVTMFAAFFFVCYTKGVNLFSALGLMIFVFLLLAGLAISFFYQIFRKWEYRKNKERTEVMKFYFERGSNVTLEEIEDFKKSLKNKN